MMDGWGWGGHDTSVLGAIISMVFAVSVIVAIVLLFVWLVRQSSGGVSPSDQGSGVSRESALDILKKRYAKGEIDKSEFEEKKKDLIE